MSSVISLETKRYQESNSLASAVRYAIKNCVVAWVAENELKIKVQSISSDRRRLGSCDIEDEDYLINDVDEYLLFRTTTIFKKDKWQVFAAILTKTEETSRLVRYPLRSAQKQVNRLFCGLKTDICKNNVCAPISEKYPHITTLIVSAL